MISALKRTELWFNEKFGWFFKNGMKKLIIIISVHIYKKALRSERFQGFSFLKWAVKTPD